MPKEIRFDTGARREFLKIRRWHAAHADESVAVGFANELDRALNRISEGTSTPPTWLLAAAR